MRMGFRFLQLAVVLQAATPISATAAGQDRPAFSIQTPIERLVADPRARAVLDRELPGFTSHPQYDQVKSMSLAALEAMFPSVIPHARVKAIDAALRAIPAPAKDSAPALAAPAPAGSR